MTKIPHVPPTLGRPPLQRQAEWPPPKLTVLNWGTAIVRQPGGGMLLCVLAPDGSEGIQLPFDAFGWAAFARDVQAASLTNGA